MLRFYWRFFTGLAALASAAMCWLALNTFTFIDRDVAYSYIVTPLIVCGVIGTVLSFIDYLRVRRQRRAASAQAEAAGEQTPAAKVATTALAGGRWKLGLAFFFLLAIAAALGALYVVHSNSIAIGTKLAERLATESSASVFRAMDGSLNLSQAAIYAFMATDDRARLLEAERAQDGVLRACDEWRRQRDEPWFASRLEGFQRNLKKERWELALLGDMAGRLQKDRDEAQDYAKALSDSLQKLAEELPTAQAADSENALPAFSFFCVQWAETRSALGRCLMPGADEQIVKTCLGSLTGMRRPLNSLQHDMSTPPGQAIVEKILWDWDRLESTMRDYAEHHAQQSEIFHRRIRALEDMHKPLAELIDQAEQFEIRFAQDLYGAAKANTDKLAILWVIAIMVSGLMAWLTSFPAFPKRADGS